MLRLNYLYSFIAGAVTVLAFAPYELEFIPFATVAFLFYQWRNVTSREAAKIGYFFGLGLMGVGVFWLHVSIAKFGGVTLLLAMLLALLFAAVVALYYALSGWLSVWLVERYRLNKVVSLIIVFPSVLVLAEILRAYFLTGFPWLSLGYSQSASPLVGVAPVAGVFAVSWLVALLAGLAVLLVAGLLKQRIGALIAILSIAGTSYGLTSIQWTEPSGDELSARIVQGNIPQELKWQPGNLAPTIDLYTQMGFEKQADLYIWPETAIPAFAHTVESTVLKSLQQRVIETGSALVLGIPVRAEDHGYYNSMLALGEYRDQYNKRHLVPFGEFAPLDFLLRPLVDFFHIPMSDFRQGEAERPLLNVGRHQAGVSICYEDAFGDETIQALPDADYLINVSNDAWFGDSLAPYQHLQIARMRAVETGRYMIRATNTGISAFIDYQGRVLKQTGQAETAVIHANIQPMKGATPYVWFKDWLIALLLVLTVLFAIIAKTANFK